MVEGPGSVSVPGPSLTAARGAAATAAPAATARTTGRAAAAIATTTSTSTSTATATAAAATAAAAAAAAAAATAAAPSPSPSAASAAVPAGPPTALPPPPPPPPLKGPPAGASVSRYRSLRGKSVSSLRPFALFRSSGSTSTTAASSVASCSSSTNTHHTLNASSSSTVASSHDEDERQHRRSKTAAAVPTRYALTPLPDFPPTPALVGPNATLKPGLTALESIKHPQIGSVEDALSLKKAVAAANRRAAAAAAAASANGNANTVGDDSPDARRRPSTALGTRPRLIPLGHAHARAEDDDARAHAHAHAHAHADEAPAHSHSHAHAQDATAADGARHNATVIATDIILSPPPPASAPAPALAPDDRDEAVLLAERLEAETDRILAEQKKLDLARLQAQLVTPPPKPSRRPLLDTFALFARGRRAAAKQPSQPTTPTTISPSIFSPAPAGSSVFSRNSSVDDVLRMSFIEPGGKGIVPQFDAPSSAINGGQRRVIVRCLSSTITLPFTAHTTPVDIVVSSAEKTNHVITPKTCVVVECYFMLGLERRLRRYERVRDVLNSWDNDEQNSLLILPCDSPDDDRDMDLDSVPRTNDPPPGFCVQLHHSARPGKWNKRWVTLLDSGQVFSSKRPEASPLDKDSTVLCHLSDFDIYSPKESEMRRNLKPPKKFCYAIKSQQKTNVFPNGENFVHFFCTDDDKLASRFYDVVHGWRSWYLANRLIDLERKEKPPQIAHGPLLGVKSLRDADKGPRVSINEAMYKSEEPLMDVSGFKVPDIVRLEPPLTKLPSKDSATSKSATSPRPETDDKDREFAAGGLLGDAYDKRKQDETANAQTRGRNAKADGPFTDGPSLLNGGVSGAADAVEKPEPKSWFPSATEHSARSRSQGGPHVGRRPMTADAAAQMRREKQHHQHQPSAQPLLSFGKDFPEPPRFRDGHGHGPPRPAAGQPLINFATGGPPPLPGAPPQRAMSRRGASGPGPGAPMPASAARGRSRSAIGQGSVSGGRRFSPEEMPPVPALPNRSVRRDKFGEANHGGGPSARHPEPLVNRAR